MTQQLYKVSTPCIDDHHFKEEEMKSVGELSHVCSQIVLKMLLLARIGRPDIIWSVNKLARSITKWSKACDKRLSCLISYIHYTCDCKQYGHVGNTTISDSTVMCENGHSIADWVCFKTQTLLEILRTQSQSQEVSCVFLEADHSSRSVGCARNKLLSRTALQSRRSLLWTLDYVWMGYLLSIFGTW